MKWTKLALTAMALVTSSALCFTACDPPPAPDLGPSEQVSVRSLEGDGTEFELDGNAVQQTTVDWNTLINPDGSTNDNVAGFSPVRFQPDVGAGDNIFTGGGSKDPSLISQWAWKTGSASPDKNNITNAYATFHIGPNGDRLLYFGADRFANNGSAELGFWFFQEEITPNPNGTFSGSHQVGDLLILANFTQGGLVANIAAFQWVGSNGDAGNGSLQTIFVGAADCSSGTETPVCAITNPGPVTAPWPYTPKQSAGANLFPTASFFEGGANLDTLFEPKPPPCFASFMATTRSSTSETATLKDFVLESFQACEPGLETTVTCDGTTLDTSDGLRIAVNWSMEVCNESTGVDLENVTVTFPDGTTENIGPLDDEDGSNCQTFKSTDAGRSPYFPDAPDPDSSTLPCEATFTIEGEVTAEADLGGSTPETLTADASDVCELCPCATPPG